MRRAAIERQAFALHAGTSPPETVLENVLPGLQSEPRLVRTRALEVAVEAAVDVPDKAGTVSTVLRDAIDDGPPLTIREIELLLPIAQERPRALADCLQSLFDVLSGSDRYDDTSGLFDSDETNRRKLAASSVIAAAVDGSPGLLQGAVPTLVELSGLESASERRCLWVLARLAEETPSIVRPTIAKLVWTLEDGSRQDRIEALSRLATLGRVVPARVPDQAIATVARIAGKGAPEVRARALYTLAAVGGRPSRALRRHAFDDDGIDGGFIGDVPDLTDELVGDDPSPPGVPRGSGIAPHRSCLIDACTDQVPAVSRAAQDAVIALGRESPAWLRSHTEVIEILITSDSPLDREAAASLIQRSLAEAPGDYLDRSFERLRRLIGDTEASVTYRATAALGSLLSELLDRESLSSEEAPSVGVVSRTLFGRYLTADRTLRTVISDSFEPIEMSDLPSAALDSGVDGTLRRIERVDLDDIVASSHGRFDVERDASDTEWSVDEGSFIDLLEFSARLLRLTDRTDSRLATAIGGFLESEEWDHARLLSTVAAAERSLRESSVSISDLLETAYWSPGVYGEGDLREEVLETIQSVDTLDPEQVAPLVADITTDIVEEETPYWTGAVAVDAVEEVFLEHPPVAEHARDGLFEIARTAENEHAGAVTRLLATALLVAPPRDPDGVVRLRDELEAVSTDPTVETWLATALLVLAPEQRSRDRAADRLRSLRVRAMNTTLGTALGVVCTTTGSLPRVLSEPLLQSSPDAVIDALQRLDSAPCVDEEAVDELVRSLTVELDPNSRDELAALLGSLTRHTRSALRTRSEWDRLLWFCPEAEQRSVLRWLTESGADGSGRAGDGSGDRFRPFQTHPNTEIRGIASAAPRVGVGGEATAGDSKSGFRTHSPRVASAGLDPSTASLPNASRMQVPLSPQSCARVSVNWDRTRAGQTDTTISKLLAETVTHGDPDETIAGLEAIQWCVEHGAVDWDVVEGTVYDHLTDRWRVVRRTAARVLLRGTWAGVADPDPDFIADRIATDDAARGVFTQVLVASSPGQWPAPRRTAAVLVEFLLSDAPHSERHAAGRTLEELVGAALDAVSRSILNGVEALDDGEGDSLAAYYLLKLFDRLVDDHDHLADDIAGYVEVILTTESTAAPAAHENGRTVGPIDPLAVRPVDRIRIYRTAVRVAANGGLRAYRGVLDPPDYLDTDDVLTVEGVTSFLRNASDDAVQEIGPRVLAALTAEQLEAFQAAWLRDETIRSTALAARRVTVIPLLAEAAESTAQPGDGHRPRYVDFVIEALTAEPAEVRVAAVESLSRLSALGQCPVDELVAHLLGRASDPSGWARRGTAEALAEHAQRGQLDGTWLHEWASHELTGQRDLRARTAAMLLGALGVSEPSLRRECLETATNVFPTGREQLDDRLVSAVDRLLEPSPTLADGLPSALAERLDGENWNSLPSG
ncbi:hypothetical protein GRX01_05195 [Halobaculum sp. WSA2]|uniref:HEAT repeat domain-containing protein n=1 Tax=Halobaculum saliterrae TaxID=2073113 RepID=A0A6B0SP93_9EURY|nr:hypothetical protein [Halobaculum saliterrae]MXR40738.1 hypothetical protein [Halobaculum saliterrae]